MKSCKEAILQSKISRISAAHVAGNDFTGRSAKSLNKSRIAPIQAPDALCIPALFLHVYLASFGLFAATVAKYTDDFVEYS